MTVSRDAKPRVLAIYPYLKGFAFAVFIGVDLIDWGLARIYSRADEETLVRVQGLMQKYSVNLLATEDGTNVRRSAWSRDLATKLRREAQRCGLQAVAISPPLVRDTFGLEPSATNHDLCTLLASYFPELQQVLPPKRRFYDPEDARTNVFRAVALAGAVIGSQAM